MINCSIELYSIIYNLYAFSIGNSKENVVNIIFRGKKQKKTEIITYLDSAAGKLGKETRKSDIGSAHLLIG